MTIVDEPKILRYEEINGVKVPVYSAKTETTIMNKKTKQIYASEEACAADIADPNTETTKDDIRRDVKVFAPKLLGIGASNTVE